MKYDIIYWFKIISLEITRNWINLYEKRKIEKKNKLSFNWMTIIDWVIAYKKWELKYEYKNWLKYIKINIKYNIKIWS